MMPDFLAARYQMAVSLGFHIVFACIGMTMPFFMFIAEWRWLKTGNEIYLKLAKAWSKGVAIFFAVGAVSGTVLSFELGLLWPKFMEHAGPIFGMPFSWEGAAFFTEAIALGLFLYGWKKLNKWVHLTSGLLVGIAGVFSGIFVVAANAWMNHPEGFDGPILQATNIDPFDAMFNAAWFSQALHMTIAAFVATGFAVAGLHALLLLKKPNHQLHQKAIKIALSFGAIAALLQPLSGDISAKDIAGRQPEKLAAMESLYKTQSSAPLIIGGIPDNDKQEVNYAVKIPGLLSFLAHGKMDAEVTGLDQFSEDEWPPVLLTHINFQLMVAIGFFLAAIAIMYFLFLFKWKRQLQKKWWLILLAVSTPLGMLAVETGWMVTELGRQPWIVYREMKTADALTSMPGIVYPLSMIITIYIILTVAVVYLMRRQIKAIDN